MAIVEGEEARANSSGLGLAIVKRILDLHGSNISVTSARGSCPMSETHLNRNLILLSVASAIIL